MIDFRYHLVSLVAVLLALATGLVVGGTQLAGLVTDDLRGQVRTAAADNRALRQQVADLGARGRGDDVVAAALTGRAVAGTLRGARVVLVATPEAEQSLLDGAGTVLGQAGATVTGRVRLTDGWADPGRAGDIRSFVSAGGAPAGFQLPESADAGVLGGALLSYALLRGTGSARAPDPAAVRQVLTGFAGLQVLQAGGEPPVPADYAVVLTSGPVRGDGADDRAGTLGALVAALDRGGKGAVVAGPAAAATGTGLLGVVRADRGAASAVSTVDDADRAAGRVALVYALAEQGAGRAGQYGTAAGAQSPLPPVPGGRTAGS